MTLDTNTVNSLACFAGAAAVPALGPTGLTMLMLLLSAAGLFAVKRLT